MDKFYNDAGKVAVLYSSGHGAGWSTWNWGDGRIGDMCTFDPEVVQWVLDGKPKNHFSGEYFEEKYGGYFYSGGLDNLVIEWMNPGQKFLITEYDGYESIEKVEDVCWREA
jgi:hypothetical protein